MSEMGETIWGKLGNPMTLRARQLDAIKDALGDRAVVAPDRTLHVDGVDVTFVLEPALADEFDDDVGDVVARAILATGGNPWPELDATDEDRARVEGN